jgi:hypothetical protein
VNAYQYIQSFFKAVLQQSVQIQGRLFIIPKEGSELNTDEFDRILVEITKGQKYPLCAMLPPTSSGVFGKSDEWEDYTFDMYFLNTTFYNGAGQVKKKNSGTATSSKPVIEEWDEMKVSATDFLRVLQLVQKGNNSTSVVMLNNMFRLTQGKKFIQPVSYLGSPRLSGVRLRFDASVWTTCTIQDYVEGGLVVLPDVEESTFEVELAVVRNEVLTIIEELGLEGIPGPPGPPGPPGTGDGDMTKSVYDTDDDGIVDASENSLALAGYTVNQLPLNGGYF